MHSPNAVPNALPYFLRMLAVRQPDRHKERLRGDVVPTVDVFITCCNEDPNVILDTVRAASVLDYPRTRYRMFVCDDGASEKVRDEVNALSHLYPNLFYTARAKGLVKDYKAGNLNHGLLFSSRTPWTVEKHSDPDYPLAALLRTAVLGYSPSIRGFSDDIPLLESPSSTRSIYNENVTFDTVGTTTSEYVAGLDADMIAEPHWLRTILPHLIEDPKVAMACPPQVSEALPEVCLH